MYNSEKNNSFKLFIEEYLQNNKTHNMERTTSWNHQRDIYIKEQGKRRQIFFLELNEINVNEITDLIPKQLSHDETANAFIEVLIKKYYKSNQTEIVNHLLIEKKEKLETTKRILSKYFYYIIDRYFPTLVNGFDQLNDIQLQFNNAYNKQKELRAKLSDMKNHYMINSSTLLMKKQKMALLIKIHRNLKQLSKWNDKYKALSQGNSDNYKTNHNYNQLKDLVHEIKLSPYSVRSAICYQMSHNLLSQSEYINTNFEEDTISLFLHKEQNINSLYTDFIMIKGDNDSMYDEAFVQFIMKSLKKGIFRVFKGTLTAYATITNENDCSNSKDIRHMKDFASFSFEEKKLVGAFKFLWSNLIGIILNYRHYMTHHTIPEKIRNLLMINKELFTDILQKKIVKVIKIFEPKILSFQAKVNRYQLLSSLNIIGSIIQKSFDLYGTDGIVNIFNEILKKSLRYECKVNIRRICIFLNADNWKRIKIKNINDILFNHKSEIEMYTKYLHLSNNKVNGNEKNNYNSITKDYTIEDLVKALEFNNITDNSFHNKKLLNKEFNEIKTTFSSSSINTIACFLDSLSYIGIGSISSGEIYAYIFLLFDYYILASLNLFASQEQIQTLLISKFDDSYSKYSSLEIINKKAAHIKKFIHLIFFIKQTSNKLEKLFHGKISFDSNNVRNDLFPQLTSEIYLDGSNPYCCLIETIICMETLTTLKKFISRTVYLPEASFYANQLSSYDIILDELKLFVYLPLCQNIFQYKDISLQIHTQNWNISEAEVSHRFNDASPLIYNLIDDTFEKLNNLTVLASSSLSESSKQRFFQCVFKYLVACLMEEIGQVQQWSSIGRSLLLKDIKILKQNIQEIIKTKKKYDSNDSFEKLILYINAWYYDSSEFLNYISAKEIPIYLITNILNSGIGITDKERSKTRSQIKKIAKTLISDINKLLN